MKQRYQPKPAHSDMAGGYVLPHDAALEQAVLGAVLLESSAVRVALTLIKQEEFFYKEPHRLVFRAIKRLFQSGTSVDILTVTAELRQAGLLDSVGGAFFVAELTMRVNSAANLETHIHYLLELFTKRRILTLAQTIHGKALDQTADPFELLSELSKGVSDTLGNLIVKKSVTAVQAYQETIQQIQRGIGKSGLVGIPTGIHSIDKLTGGWRPGDLIIIAARPAMGKTAVAIQYLKNAVLAFGKTAAIFSLEMSYMQLMYRLIASESEFTNNQLSKSELTVDELEEVAIMSAKLQNEHMLLDDTPGLSIMELRTKALKMKADHDIQLLIVDYLQLMQGEKGGNREQEISSISRGLKLIAKEIKVPVIALSQLSRSVESRGGDKKPQLSDLRESGSIEQDADTVVFLYRPEYYGITEDELGNSTAGTLQHIFAKHRNGPLDTIITRCDLAHNRIQDFHTIWEPDHKPNALPASNFEYEQPGF
ncbi:replicative DNA helicase [Pontibacter burrus]|uniref:Replicative DNA helicase n=1 Tax=Pontibacter burrus TaxID=2704466 RepID=A0A6B3LRR0_9BACT|nr:replicative DNA helicase [Pontibacter burrus]NEM96184.1 replicative DNA helicase [Pontibacter burrus]